MRDIKFRLYWDTPNGGILTRGLDLFSIYEEMDGSPPWGAIEQYTGLKDKDGVEIYEGDIIRLEGQPREIRYWSEFGMFGLVGPSSYAGTKKDRPMGSFGSSTPYKPYILNKWYQKRIKVIGNIHQNPELLKD